MGETWIASWNADVVGDAWEYIESDGRFSGIDDDIEGRGRPSGSTSSSE
jgi:hypothetical protein